MRKLLLVCALATLAAAAFASTASARTVRFTVQTVNQSHHQRQNGAFIQRGQLVRAHNRSAVVGHFKARFTKPHGRPLRVRAVFFFPAGKIKAKGQLGRDNRILIIGGTRGYNGAAGKIKAHGKRLHFTVVR